MLINVQEIRYRTCQNWRKLKNDEVFLQIYIPRMNIEMSGKVMQNMNWESEIYKWDTILKEFLLW